jgi:hypothetical protein
VNVDKQGLKAKREKLKKDRFKQKEKLSTSKVDKLLIKRLKAKQERKQ